MPNVVALSGGIASGKTAVANLFAAYNVPIIDADVIARQVVEPHTLAFQEIVQHFGQEILLANGHLDRSQLREIIFNNDHERLWLSNLLHPIIHQETLQQIKQQSTIYVLWVIPLLIENNLQELADRILIIDIPKVLQVERLKNRDNIDAKLAEKMIAAQASQEKRLSLAHDVIYNTCDYQYLQSEVLKLHRFYTNMFSSDFYNQFDDNS